MHISTEFIHMEPKIWTQHVYLLDLLMRSNLKVRLDLEVTLLICSQYIKPTLSKFHKRDLHGIELEHLH